MAIPAFTVTSRTYCSIFKAAPIEKAAVIFFCPIAAAYKSG